MASKALEFAIMARLFSLLFVCAVVAEEVSLSGTDAAGECKTVTALASSDLSPRPARLSPGLADIIGLDQAKSVLREAVVLPLSSPALTNGDPLSRLFWRSGERSAVLLAGPAGLGKTIVVEAAAAAAGADILFTMATEAVRGEFCQVVSAAAAKRGESGRTRPMVVLVEHFHMAPESAESIRRCLKELTASSSTASLGNAPSLPRVAIVATMDRDVRAIGSSDLVPFGYVVRLGLPNNEERRQFLLRAFDEVSHVDPQWASALREAALSTLANLTDNYTFAEIDLVVRRAFLRSTSAEDGSRSPVAIHHFEKIIEDTIPQASGVFYGFPEPVEVRVPLAPEGVSTAESKEPVSASGSGTSNNAGNDKKKARKSKDTKDPMDGIFGWCNFWLPESLHLPPVMWAMIIFGILAHFMARSTYQPYGQRKRGGNGGPGGRSSLFGDMGGGGSNNYGFYSASGGGMGDLYPGGSPFANFPPPPNMPRRGGPGDPASGATAGAGAAGAAPGGGDASSSSAAGAGAAGASAGTGDS
eukprot:TRINITY_DN28832_c0_g1_i1.p1 TRINITY_DN28832_c0_g1~~TRINITY_DN28832_c0_g1_i1.p1  ORF type:complete len:530 (+),score=91.70 TRINITY_DN28832_c0_g1_i1:41-1630(+)